MKKRITALLLIFVMIICCLTACGESSGKDITCTISVNCNTIAAQRDKFAQYESVIPEDGTVLETTELTLSEGSTAYDALTKAAEDNDILVAHKGSAKAKTIYIQGINGLYEFYGGDKSGWMYSVNGEFPNVGCSGYELKDGDEIVFAYTLHMGDDLETLKQEQEDNE